MKIASIFLAVAGWTLSLAPLIDHPALFGATEQRGDTAAAMDLEIANEVLGQRLCKKVESYQPGSNHYLYCIQESLRWSGFALTHEEFINIICHELVDLFYREDSLERCLKDGREISRTGV